MDNNLLTAILTACGSLVLSLVTLLITRIDKRTTMEKLKALKQSDLEGLYIICPKCGERVALDMNPIIMAVGGNKDDASKK